MKIVNIIENKEIAPEIYLISFGRFFDFIPGQVVKITTHDSVAPRMYSIASGSEDNYIQIIYDVKPEGQLTNMLKVLGPGDKLQVSMPFGQFNFAGDKSWWIATGTGIAPFRSMLRSGFSNDIVLLHGARNPEHFFFGDELAEKLKNNYHPCCSGKTSKGVFQGRVTDFLKKLGQIPADARFYLCGSAEMVVDVRDLLIEHHVPFGNIYSEIYF